MKIEPSGELVIAVICARGGSKGLKRKNLRVINNETLIGRAVSHAKKSKLIDHIVVSTDDEEIADSAAQAGAEVPFIRPGHLSQDLTTTEETLRHAILETESIKSVKYDIAVFLTPTDIFRDPSWIDQSIQKLQENSDLESVFVGYKTHKNYWERQEDGSWKRLRDWMAIYSSRQIRRSIVREDTGLACASRAELWRQGRRIGDKVEIIETDDPFTAIDIHHLEDLELAQSVKLFKLLRYIFSQLKKGFHSHQD